MIPPDRTRERAAESSAGEGLVGLGRSLNPVDALAADEAVDMVFECVFSDGVVDGGCGGSGGERRF